MHQTTDKTLLSESQFSARRAARCGPSITCGRFSREKKPKSIIVPGFSIESTNGRQIVQRKLKRRSQYEPRKKCTILEPFLGNSHFINRDFAASSNTGPDPLGTLGVRWSDAAHYLGRCYHQKPWRLVLLSTLPGSLAAHRFFEVSYVVSYNEEKI